MEIPASLLMTSGIHAYVVVKASLQSTNSLVFGLSKVETDALVKKFDNFKEEVMNGCLIRGSPIQVVNALAELGYRVVGTTGDAEVVFTMQRDI
ncbi:uncharacterized protein [Onthophagus taurus]|uniref:uncharacterized protein n=1 Tax=Onthophagus taurus TaxID=166361 RepID=UPI0039BE2F2F